MSSIQKFITKLCKQTAVYWGNPVNDGQGGKTFDAPVEIKCRWVDMMEVITDKHGKQIECSSKVMVTQDLDEEGYLYLGTLDSIYDTLESSAATIPNPTEINRAYEIKRLRKVPEIFSTTEFVRTVYLK